MLQTKTTALLLCLALAQAACEGGDPQDDDETAGLDHTGAERCSRPAVNTGKACDLGNGHVKFQVRLPRDQFFVEVFARHDGVQDVADGIGAHAVINKDGKTATYFLERAGYKKGQKVDFRFYSFLPLSPGVFTPGPGEEFYAPITIH